MNTKKCTKCGLEKQVENFKKDCSKKDGLSSSCKDCHKKLWKDNYHRYAESHRAKNRKYRIDNLEKVNIFQKKYRVENFEKLREYTKHYRSEHREMYLFNKKAWKANKRAAKFGLSDKITSEDVKNIYIKYNGTCAYCGRVLGLIYTIDHIIPYAKGGQNVPENITIACMQCNTKKHTDDAEVFKASLLA